jgi:glucose-1-phosphate thymidylyltransferase
LRKGIILAGGKGSRLYPLTLSVTKQLLPIYDKPMIFYPLSILLQLNIKEILIISTEKDQIQFQNLLGNGSNFGVNFSYETQKDPKGIAEGLIIAEQFLANDPCVFILGDNLFIGSIDQKKYMNELLRTEGATIFSYKVKDPERYGVVTLNKENKPITIVEKPKIPISNNAITGLYFYDKNVCQIAKTLKPSYRNELEITDVNKIYLEKKLLNVKQLDDNITWLDAGTIESLYESSDIVYAIEKRTGKKIACLEEIAFNNKNISLEKLKEISVNYGSSEYGSYLRKIINNLHEKY